MTITDLEKLESATDPDTQDFPFGSVYSDGSIIARADELPWTEWGMPGTWFKLLDVNDDFGFFAILLKVDPGTEVAMHRHFSAAFAFTLEGWWGYEGRVVKAGQYFKEAGGIDHAPVVGPEGTTMLAWSNCPIGGLDDNGELAAVIDIDWMYEAAKANGAADHILRKN